MPRISGTDEGAQILIAAQICRPLQALQDEEGEEMCGRAFPCLSADLSLPMCHILEAIAKCDAVLPPMP